MKYFANIDVNSVVETVIVAETLEWCETALGGTWVETWVDGGERKNYAGIGFTYDEDRDAFIPPKPYESWVLDEATCLWVAPIEYPADGGQYEWDESEGDWV